MVYLNIAMIIRRQLVRKVVQHLKVMEK